IGARFGDHHPGRRMTDENNWTVLQRDRALRRARSSSSDVSGFWTATAFNPAFSSNGITLDQLDPSAHAPCTKTTLRTPWAATEGCATRPVASATANIS